MPTSSASPGAAPNRQRWTAVDNPQLERLAGHILAFGVFWGMCSLLFVCCDGSFCFDSADYTISNQSGGDLVITPVGPPDADGNVEPMWRHGIQSRRFVVADRARIVLNLEIGDYPFDGFVVEPETGPPRFVVDSEPALELKSLDSFPEATSEQLDAHRRGVRAIASVAAWGAGPPVVLGWMTFSISAVYMWLRTHIARRRDRRANRPSAETGPA